MPKTKIKLGRDIEPGDQLLLEDGRFAGVSELVKAPIRMVDDNDQPIRGLRWAYLSVGGHATIAADDEVTVRA